MSLFHSSATCVTPSLSQTALHPINLFLNSKKPLKQSCFKGFFIKVFKTLAAPFLKLFGFLKRVFGKISQKSRKKAVKAAKKSKIHLKLCGSLLYNQLNNKRNYPKMRKEVKQNGCRKKSGKSKEEKR